MNTVFMLLAQFEETIIPLGKICDEYFGCSLRTAMNKAKAEELPIPTFKIGSSAKAPYYIHLNDLAEYIDAQRAKAKEEWCKVNTQLDSRSAAFWVADDTKKHQSIRHNNFKLLK